MDRKYLPDEPNLILVHAIEECAELQKALTKTLRFGQDNTNPVTGKSNVDKIWDEWQDVKDAMKRVFEVTGKD